ncbi:MAG: SGNH/GDSL hydrolase family protein [Chitinophagales bacterium]
MKPIFKTILGVFFSGCVILIVLLLLEIIYSFSDKYPLNGQEYNRYTLWHWRQRLSTTASNEELGVYKLNTDKHGFRNVGKSYDPDKTKCRILVMGDSYTAGLYLPQKNIYSQMLEDNLKAITTNGKHIEVFNISCPGWGTDQEYMALIHEGLAIKPDYVLLMVCPNDIRETYCKKYAELKGDSVIFNAIPFTGTELLCWKLSNYSHFYQYLQRKVFYTDCGSGGWLWARWPMNFGKEDATDWDSPLFLKQPFSEVQQARKLHYTLLKNMQQQCKANGTVLTLSCVPLVSEFNGSMQNDSSRQAGLVAQNLDSFCKANSIDYVNLFTVFQNYSTPVNLFRNNGDTHWNAKGAEVAATTLTTYYKGLFTKP